ncbi:MAG: ABC transporter substrate-binding protein, partial [Bacteroidales bacterium]
RIALLLPLQLDQSANKSVPLRMVDAEALAALEFYEGALLAFDSLKQAGLRTELYLFDTGKSAQTLRQTLNLAEMQRMDLIIGPFFSDMLPMASDFSRQHRIPLAVPTLPIHREEFLNNPYLIAVNPEPTRAVRTAFQQMASLPDSRVTLVINPDETSTHNYRLYTQLLEETLPGRFHTVSGTAPQSAIAEGKQNLFIIPSTDEGFVSRTLASLNLAAKTHNITVFAPPSWNQFETIDLDYFHNVQYRYWSGFSIDYNKPETQSFLRNFQQAFRSEPYRKIEGSLNYGFLGYDLSLFLGSALLYYGNEITERLPGHTAAFTQTAFSFGRSREGALVNSRIYLITFARDLTLHTTSL